MEYGIKVVYGEGNVSTGIELSGYSKSNNLIALYYENPVENLSGFTIVDAEGGVILDGSDFIYRWDVVDQKENAIYYTNDLGYRQSEPWPDLSNIPEQTDPLSNEELTEAVADLMYEVSVAQLGL